MLTAAASPYAPGLTGDDLLIQARQGNESAFAALVREHQGMVFGLAYHFLQCRAQAEELAQDVFLALHQNLARVESGRRLVVTLRFQEDLNMSEISEIVGMPVNTVKSHLRRSMDTLRRKLKDKGHVYES